MFPTATENISRLIQSHADVIEFLGPVMEQFLRRLDQHIRYLDDGDTAFLFMTRAGIRIKQLHELYISRFGRKVTGRAGILFSSRLLTCKGTSSLQPLNAIDIIGSEHAHFDLRDTLAAVYASRPDADRERALAFDFGHQPLHEFYFSDHPGAAELRRYMDEQSNLFQSHLKQVTHGARRIVLVDSGWQGTSQRLLSEAFPEKEWHGLYFGWMEKKGDWNAGKWGQVTGLIFESPCYVRNRPETAIAAHRHLIESLLEVNAPSLEELKEDASYPGGIGARGWEGVLKDEFSESSDPLYAELLRYFETLDPHRAGVRVGAYLKAIRVLEEKILSPKRSEVAFLKGKLRSADFGRTLLVPVLIDKKDKDREATPTERIARSLWPEGQIALEYSEEKASRMHRTRIHRAELSDTHPAPAMEDHDPMRGRVAIVTRTKDRPILLTRAAQSVASQTYANYVWVVVNDGGDPEALFDVIGECDVPSHQIIVCSNICSLGMEAASNIGIKASSSEYVVIHDDDDSWHPEFLEHTVKFLSGAAGAKYGGVITHSVYVSEEIVGESVTEWGRWPYQDWVQHVQLSELVIENFYPPIAFLFRREICERIGFFDEQLPVLGDWDFNIRFLLEANIGVIPQQLAYYHHRDRGQAGVYSNSVLGGISKHVEYNAILRNKYIRGYGEHPKWGPAASLLASGYAHRDIRNRLTSLINTHSKDFKADFIPASVRTPRVEEISIADYRWCLLQAYRYANRGVLRRLARLLRGLPSTDSELSKWIRKTPLMPPPDFDEQTYLGSHADIREAVEQGRCASGYDHYIKFGKAEGRGRPQTM
jgi:glycosyltransferase involved in cell wall biosynthesis